MNLLFLAIAIAAVIYVVKNSGSPTRPTKKTTPKPGKPATLRLHYRDSEGNETTRDVSPYTRATNERFHAFCHLRGEAREFVFSRAIGGVDLVTGELLDRAGVFRHIHPTRKIPKELL